MANDLNRHSPRTSTRYRARTIVVEPAIIRFVVGVGDRVGQVRLIVVVARLCAPSPPARCGDSPASIDGPTQSERRAGHVPESLGAGLGAVFDVAGTEDQEFQQVSGFAFEPARRSARACVLFMNLCSYT